MNDNPCPFFSVIVPAHNSAKYLRKCLKSIRMQAFTNYELIVVCDACTDNTASVARKYADRVYETNHGMDGLARNTGLDHSRGEWILFLDDDDWWIHEYVLNELYKATYTVFGRANMICFDFIWKGRGYTVNFPERMNIAVWSKAFRRDLIGDTRFPAIPFTSDKNFMDEIIAKRPVCWAMNQLIYYYNYMRKGSQTEQHSKNMEV